MRSPAELWREIDTQLEGEDDVSRRRTLIERLLAEVGPLDARESSDVSYLRGYLLYLHPSRLVDPTLRERLLQALEAARDAETPHPLASMYLGHDAYDRGAYQAASAHFDATQIEALEPFLRLKLLEIRLCTRARLRSLASCIEDVRELVRECEAIDPILVQPLNLSRLLQDLGAQAVTPELRAELLRLDRCAGSAWMGDVLDGRDGVTRLVD